MVKEKIGVEWESQRMIISPCVETDLLGGNLLAPKFHTYNKLVLWAKNRLNKSKLERPRQNGKTLREISKLKWIFDQKVLNPFDWKDSKVFDQKETSYLPRKILNLEKGGKSSSLGSWGKQRGVKRGVEAHEEDTCLHPGARQLFDGYLALV